jgi:hypothetical protein
MLSMEILDIPVLFPQRYALDPSLAFIISRRVISQLE